jgi:hypothetical protein
LASTALSRPAGAMASAASRTVSRIIDNGSITHVDDAPYPL